MIRQPGMSFKGQGVSESFVGRTSGAARASAAGLRVIYFYWVRGLEFWLFTLYNKNERSDLSKKDRATLESLLKIELKMRK
jgi:hypothetical protein